VVLYILTSTSVNSDVRSAYITSGTFQNAARVVLVQVGTQLMSPHSFDPVML
jgi:hypothetical protein